MGWISSEVRKANKTHTCYCCGHKINKGEMYDRTFCTDGGDVWCIAEHKRCRDLIAELDAAYLMESGEYTSDDFEVAVTELCRSEICPHCPDYDTDLKDCAEDNWIVKDCMKKVWEFAKTHFFNTKTGKWEERHDDTKAEGSK